jgi:hypothetical protein
MTVVFLVGVGGDLQQPYLHSLTIQHVVLLIHLSLFLLIPFILFLGIFSMCLCRLYFRLNIGLFIYCINRY